MQVLGFKWNGHLTGDNPLGRWERGDTHLPDSAFLDSIDAALALVERVLPGHRWIIGDGRSHISEPRYAAQIFPPYDVDEDGAICEIAPLAEAEHEHSAALAICTALLKALSTTPEKENDNA